MTITAPQYSWFTRWFRIPRAWRNVSNTRVWLYQENTVTGHRRAIWQRFGYQPIDMEWLQRKRIDPREPPLDPPALGFDGIEFDRDGNMLA